jgi:hypothetical protein
MIKALCCILIVMGISISYEAIEDTGTVGGTVVIVTGDHKSGGTIGHATMFFMKGNEEVKITSNENGDIRALLPIGTYWLSCVKDDKGHDLLINDKQRKDLVIRANEHTRFDIRVGEQRRTTTKKE